MDSTHTVILMSGGIDSSSVTAACRDGGTQPSSIFVDYGQPAARSEGKVLGPPRKFRHNQVETMRRMREGGASLRRIAADFECSASTVLRVLQREGVAP